MKRTHRLTAVLLAFCLAATTLSTGVTAGAAEMGTTRNVSGNLRQALASAKDGDTLVLDASCFVDSTNKDAPWVIDKSVTLQGGTLTLREAGIILGTDVTFNDVTLSFEPYVRNAIVANGHKLTLNNVTASAGARPINLFCGGYVKGTHDTFTDADVRIPSPGTKGEIIITGNTDLTGAGDAGTCNIYAGSMCLGGMNPDSSTENGPNNAFTGTANIQIEGSPKVGDIYACGAQQKNPEGQSSGKVTLPNPENYRVNGTVNVTLSKGATVYGKGSTATNVTYTGSGNLSEPLLQDISTLTVESGKLTPAATSSFQNVSLNSGATLGLTNVTAIPGTFTGGGSLILGQDQTLTIEGTVSETTKVGIGGFNYDGTQSSSVPTMGKTYIQAPKSTNTSFQLAPYANQTDAKFTRNDTGDWIVTKDGTGDDTTLVKSFTFAPDTPSAPTTTEGTEIDLDLVATAADDTYVMLDFIPLNITVNGKSATRDGPDTNGYYRYTSSTLDLSMTVIDSSLGITPASGSAGTYRIDISIPKDLTTTGSALTVFTNLTVTKADLDPNLKTATIPTALSLKWTGTEQTGVSTGEGYTLTGNTGTNVGNYTAKATLQDGYQWIDGSTDEKDIPWSIAKANGPAAPEGFSTTAPTGPDVHDGTIKGTTADMEYSTDANFTTSTP